ncbi:MAG: DedA family protein [Psychromonas sp.]
MFEVLTAIWSQDFSFLAQSEVQKYLIIALCIIIFLESAVVFLPLPGDSLIIFSMLLASNGVIDTPIQLLVLPLLSALGTYCAFVQGRWLRSGVLNDWIKRAISEKHLQKTTNLLTRYGLLSLVFSKFIPFVRVLVPMFMGMTHFDKRKVALLSALSSFIWILSLSFISQLFYTYIDLGGMGDYVFKGFTIMTVCLFLTATSVVTYRLLGNKEKVVNQE